MSKIPGITWYQNLSHVYINLDLGHHTDMSERNYHLDIQDDILSFSYAKYQLKTSLYAPASLEKSTDNGRYIKVTLQKTIKQIEEEKEQDKETSQLDDKVFWNYLTNDAKFNKSHVKIDWQNWVDEDELDDTGDENNGMGGMNMEEMMKMGGMSGMDGMDGMDMSQLMQNMEGGQEADGGEDCWFDNQDCQNCSDHCDCVNEGGDDPEPQDAQKD